MKRLSVLLVFLILAALACHGESAAPASTPTKTSGSLTPTPTATSGSPSGGQPRRGGVFRRLWAEPPTLDPHLAQDTSSAAIVVEVFSGLVAISSDLQIIPDIAKGWEIADSGTTYTFHLRDDVRFHNGKRLTARDFKYSLERATDPRTQSPVAQTYLGDIVGAKEHLRGQANAVSGVQVLDDYTLRIKVDAPKVYILAKLTFPTAFVVDKENIEKLGNRWAQAPNGTGPFKVKEYRIGDIVNLERNDGYYGGAPYLDRVEFILRGGSSMAMYENGEIDLAGVGLDALSRVEDPASPLNKELVTAAPQFSLSYIGFSITTPPFDDIKVRQAMTYAINKELIASEVLGGLDVPAYSILPPGFPGYNAQLQGIRFDAERAKALLRASKYDPSKGNFPKSVVLTVPGTGGSAGLDLEVVIELWRQTLGIEVEIRQVEWATYLQELNRRSMQLYAGLGWQADYPDPENFLDILFHSQSEVNHGAYANAQVDLLLEQARVEQNVQRRLQLYQDAERLITEEAFIIPLWYTGEQKALVKPYVKGYRFTPMTLPKLKDVWIDKG
ncbi:MAG: peptide ABC transporter substrate-binding protein [Dehalococcoidia bacterium]|nr:peptide ABC transporter substrate-binding protein [Dehalococcoidia bacterium]